MLDIGIRKARLTVDKRAVCSMPHFTHAAFFFGFTWVSAGQLAQQDRNACVTALVRYLQTHSTPS